MTRKTKASRQFQMRGESMDRIETFVAAAFAFAVTMLVISVDDVPSNFEELVYAVKLVPSFAASFAVILWIWATHANWCRRYGLEDGWTVVLSGSLVLLVLVYMYPLRIMMQGLFAALSGGYLPVEMAYSSSEQVRFMFAFYAVGFFALAMNFYALYRYAASKGEPLALTEIEIFHTRTEIQSWLLTALVASLSFALALLLPLERIGLAGYTYFLLFPLLSGHGVMRGKRAQRL